MAQQGESSRNPTDSFGIEVTKLVAEPGESSRNPTDSYRIEVTKLVAEPGESSRNPTDSYRIEVTKLVAEPGESSRNPTDSYRIEVTKLVAEPGESSRNPTDSYRIEVTKLVAEPGESSRNPTDSYRIEVTKLVAEPGESTRNPTDSYGIEMTELMAELKEKLSALQPGDSQHPPPTIIIGKVRDPTRNVDSCEYDPQHIAIGPYNYRSPNSQKPDLAMEQEKLKCVQAVLLGTEVDDYVKMLAALQEWVRTCYAHSFPNITPMQFVRMLLLDGCWILDRFVNHRAQHVDKAVKLAEFCDVFFLAENQIPFSVLEDIGKLSASIGRGRVTEELTKQALDLMIDQSFAVALPAPAMVQNPGNLLQLVHMQLKPSEVPTSPAAIVIDADRKKVPGRWRSATEYYFAGLTFKRRDMNEDGPARCILDVKLGRSGGTLEIPCLNIDNETWRFLRNLMELEQRNGPPNYITAYCIFISQVACTTKDVEFLCNRGIIEHSHGNNDEVAKCFADLCKGIIFDPNDPHPSYLQETRYKLEERFQSYPRKLMAWLKHRYFSNPWLAIGLLAAAIGLLCELIQAVFSVLDYKHG